MVWRLQPLVKSDRLKTKWRWIEECPELFLTTLTCDHTTVDYPSVWGHHISTATDCSVILPGGWVRETAVFPGQSQNWRRRLYSRKQPSYRVLLTVLFKAVANVGLQTQTRTNRLHDWQNQQSESILLFLMSTQVECDVRTVLFRFWHKTLTFENTKLQLCMSTSKCIIREFKSLHFGWRFLKYSFVMPFICGCVWMIGQIIDEELPFV